MHIRQIYMSLSKYIMCVLHGALMVRAACPLHKEHRAQIDVLRSPTFLPRCRPGNIVIQVLSQEVDAAQSGALAARYDLSAFYDVVNRVITELQVHGCY